MDKHFPAKRHSHDPRLLLRKPGDHANGASQGHRKRPREEHPSMLSEAQRESATTLGGGGHETPVQQEDPASKAGTALHDDFITPEREQGPEIPRKTTRTKKHLFPDEEENARADAEAKARADKAKADAATTVQDTQESTEAGVAASKSCTTSANIGRVLAEHWPGREDQIKQLLQLMGEPTAPTLPLYVHGPAGGGKSHLLRELLQGVPGQHAVVDCVECGCQRRLFENILDQLHGHVPSSENGYSHKHHCDKLTEFLRKIKDIGPQKPCTSYIVFDRAERLVAMGSTFIQGLLTMRQLTAGANVTPIFVSEALWPNFHGCTGHLPLITVSFPAYSDAQIQRVLMLDCPPDGDAKVFQGYVPLFVKLFLDATRDLHELRYLCRLLFEHWMQPVRSGTIQPQKTSQLFKKAEGKMKEFRKKIYMRDIASATTSERRRPSLELPMFSKFLLIAAYLATHNPPRLDMAFFHAGVHPSGKRRTVLHTKDTKVGPMVFPLERMLAIYRCLQTESEPLEAEVFVQVASLVQVSAPRAPQG